MPTTVADHRSKIGLRILVAATTLCMIITNVLANTIPFFGRSTGDVSALYPTLITPAGYVFAIWGLIYLGLLAYSAAQFMGHLAKDPLPDRLAWPLIVSNVANVVWLLLWHSLNIYWTVPIMLVLLVSLSIAYRTARTSRPLSPPALERWAVRAPLSVYLGWISVATIANISNALVAAKWDGFNGIASDQSLSVVVLLLATGLSFTGLAREGDGIFAGVFVWALAGIAVATPSPLVQLVSGGFAVAIAVGILIWELTSWRVA